MQRSAERWPSSFRGVPAHPAGLTSSRIDLRVQAIDFASRGWPVLPGTYPDRGEWIGQVGRRKHGPAPVLRDWRKRPGADLDDIMSWWDERPHNLLVATGTALDAIEVDATLGFRAAKVLRASGFPVPIVSTPTGDWFFLMNSGGELAGELAARDGIRLHADGSWVPLPPSSYPGGAVHWRVKPEVCAWQLPDPDFVQDALLEALDPENVAEPLAAGR
ncbi:bifunctional DNA primase/polymerase [Saccharopolyspora griseoalba]|uniref:Bifunctional DNA primase/polymerase n=1 Tax=Saccharopolyspora griseoalba TaxID=1431848 RepID=A0ABW2LJY5_9PSEU